jgi:hypothetical protein
MATTTALTFKRSVIVKKLETRVADMKKEIADWEKESKSLEAKQTAWKKKARAWLKKNAASVIDEDTSVYPNNHYLKDNVRFTIEVSDRLFDAIGDYPEQNCRPTWDRQEYRTNTSPIDELEANIAAFKSAEEDEIKVSIKNNLFKYIK